MITMPKYPTADLTEPPAPMPGSVEEADHEAARLICASGLGRHTVFAELTIPLEGALIRIARASGRGLWCQGPNRDQVTIQGDFFGIRKWSVVLTAPAHK